MKMFIYNIDTHIVMWPHYLGLFWYFYGMFSATAETHEEALAELEATCDTLVKNETTRDTVYLWSFIDSLYFSMTVTTTIGEYCY